MPRDKVRTFKANENYRRCDGDDKAAYVKKKTRRKKFKNGLVTFKVCDAATEWLAEQPVPSKYVHDLACKALGVKSKKTFYKPRSKKDTEVERTSNWFALRPDPALIDAFNRLESVSVSDFLYKLIRKDMAKHNR